MAAGKAHFFLEMVNDECHETDYVCALPMFDLCHFRDHFPKLQSSSRNMATTVQDKSCTDSLAAAEGYKSIFSSPLEQKIFLDVSKRFLEKETAKENKLIRQQQKIDREFYELFRINVLRIMHTEEQVSALMQIVLKGGCLALDQFRKGLEKAYPMFYLAIGLQAFGPHRVSALNMNMMFNRSHKCSEMDSLL